MFGKKKEQQNENAPVMTPDSGRLVDDDTTAVTGPDDFKTPLTKTEEFSAPAESFAEAADASAADQAVPAGRLQRSGQKGKAKKKAKAGGKVKGTKKAEGKPKKSMKALLNQDVSLKKVSLKDISISKASLKSFLSKSNGKDPYPVKTDMNLMKRPTMDKIMPNVVVYGILCILVVLLILMFAIFGPLSNYKELLDDYDTTQATLDSYTQKLQDYAEVEKQYQIYSYGYLSEEEAALVDRLDILSLLDTCAGSRGKVTAVGIAGNTVAVTLNVSSLQVVSDVLADLYRSPYVTSVTVNNAANQDSSITSNMVIQVADPSAEEEPTELALPGVATDGTEEEVQ